jgi:phage shock protein PspC (stress-responsive transcriptional regulator)
MKKTISITISGIIFHIEDDGYEKLKSYLDSIHRYFATYDDNHEIISDIESRIAEKFLAKLTPERQVVTLEDVSALIATMGSTEDFAAAEAEAAEDLGIKSNNAAPHQKSKINLGKNEEPPISDFLASKKLYRDKNRKLLGGVAAGIAHYFATDPLWLRLLIACFFFGLWIFPPITGFIVLAYITLWAVVPAAELPDNSKIRKLYRDKEKRVVGGLAAGLAAYFDTDVTVIRLLLVLGIFLGGSTLFIYVLLWAITPEAKTLTEKMEMQGEPVTLNNIEKSIKNSLNVPENQSENFLVKALLFPFRAFAVVFNGLAKMIQPIASFGFNAVRIFVGAFMLFISVVLLIAGFVCLGALLGLVNSSSIQIANVPALMLAQDFPTSLTIIGFIAYVIPVVMVGIMGLGLLTRKVLLAAFVGWTALGLWLLAIMGIAFFVPSYIEKFKYEGRIENEEYVTLTPNTLHLEFQDGGEEGYHGLNIRLKGYDGGDSLKLLKVFRSNGESREQAKKNASTISYSFAQKDSTFLFDDNIAFNPTATFRAQHANVSLYIPYDKPFKMSQDVARRIENIVHVEEWDEVANETFMFTREKGLVCATCPPSEEDEDDEDEDRRRRNKRKKVKTRIKIETDTDSVDVDTNVEESTEEED